MNPLFNSLQGKTNEDLYLENAIRDLENAIQLAEVIESGTQSLANASLLQHLLKAKGALQNIHDIRSGAVAKPLYEEPA